MPITNGNIYWYVLFAQTGSEEKLAIRLKEELGEGHRAFVPQKTCVFRRQGIKSLFKKICFPGYVFIESDKPPFEFITHISPIVYRLNNAYRFLYYGDKFNIAMLDEERAALSEIFGNDYCISISRGFKEGDSIRIVSGTLIGRESKILHINRSRQSATITINMYGTEIPISVGFEFIEKFGD